MNLGCGKKHQKIIMKPLIVGIAGGTGSGKTTLANTIITYFGQHCTSLIDADSYYLDRSHLPLRQRHHCNFDHPDALDISLLANHIRALKQGNPIQKQIYDFATHTRKKETIRVSPRDLILVEGILIFALSEICELFDLKVFIDEEADLRLLRRVTRDVNERGRTLEAVFKQYLETVRPMHLQFVEPSKGKADIILKPNENSRHVIASIQAMLGG